MPEYETPQHQPVSEPTGAESHGADSGGADVNSLVMAPAIALMVVSGISALAFLAIAVLGAIAISFGKTSPGLNQGDKLLQGLIGAAFYGFLAVLNIITLLAANKMRTLSGYGFAMAACIMALVPGVSPCCLIGIPFGIWGLVVLTKPEVKDAFR
jgi:hypothetical protein